MVAHGIRGAIRYRWLVLLASLALAGWGFLALPRLPVAVLPDLAQTQLVLHTAYPGQAPYLVDSQLNAPLTAALLALPGVETVRAHALFGDSLIYIVFDADSDPSLARSRLAALLGRLRDRLPATARPSIGPETRAVDWVYQYALQDRSGQYDLAQLRSLQDWFLRPELESLPDVAEAAAIGGVVKQYQVLLKPARLAALRLLPARVIAAIRQANPGGGDAVQELADSELLVRASRRVQTLNDLRRIPLPSAASETDVHLGDVATVQLGPEARQGVAELNGDGETVGGIVLLRTGGDVQPAVAAIKARLAALAPSLPPGIEIVPTYDRSQWLGLASAQLQQLLWLQIVAVLLGYALLGHWRSVLPVLALLALDGLAAVLVLQQQAIAVTVVSLGSVALALAVAAAALAPLVDGVQGRLAAWQRLHPGLRLGGAAHWRGIGDAAAEVGPPLFCGQLGVALSLLLLCLFEAQEGRLLTPLLLSLSGALAVNAVLSVTLLPVLLGYALRGRLTEAPGGALGSVLRACYRPLLDAVLRWPRRAVLLMVLVVLGGYWPLLHLGAEFLPALDEGELLYMPTALPGLPAATAADLLQQLDHQIKAVPEVASVQGKAGRAESASDAAPLEMFEALIRLRPRAQWRPGMTPARLQGELDRAVQLPGLVNLWRSPYRSRVDLLLAGVKSPVGVRVTGGNLAEIDRVAQAIEQQARGIAGVAAAVAERLHSGGYLEVDIDSAVAARHGLSVADVQAVVAAAVGGENVGVTGVGSARYPISVRFPQELRDSLADLRQLPIPTESGQLLTLGSLARIGLGSGPPLLKSENGLAAAWVYIDVRDRDLVAVVDDLRAAVAGQLQLPPGIGVAYVGQYADWQRAYNRWCWLALAAAIIVLLLLCMALRRLDEALLVMATLPLALSGALWWLYALGYPWSVASGVGWIALLGLAAQHGALMLADLKQAVAACRAQGSPLRGQALDDAIRAGVLQRLSGKALAIAVLLAGLLPLLLVGGSATELLRHIVAPVAGGMIAAPLASLLLSPAVYRLLRRERGRSPQPTSRLASGKGGDPRRRV